MSGVLSVLVASGVSSRHIVTVAAQGSFSIAGYSRPDTLNFGSIDTTTTLGVTIDGIYSRSSADLQVWFVGSHAQNKFSSITIEAGDSAIRTYQSASADLYQDQTSVTLWAWGDGSSVVWDPADATEQHWLVFRF